MHGPEPVAWLLFGVCALAAAVCLRRTRSGPAAHRRTAATEAVMALGMAAMALPPQPVPAAAFAVLFTAVAAHSAALLVQGAPHQAHHFAEAAAMVYMALAMPDPAAAAAHAGHEPGGVPWVTGALLVYFGLYTLRTGTRLMPGPDSGGPAATSGSPEVAVACRLTLALGMSAMLVGL
ncbi:DUF5134 domain-containing protein [Streptomyces sp. 549]|uniref:DUF5134 domain-containing protein n=1 Tax=Streptomyces sp. 549 TaxID=3049076 RepID=UPI0024C3F299|nr:DUF5134 domain-containing protein [Streptomyces sp. 549]MDK1474703.1 DUF5134 domain-containing protein [Streptomyces sp. 549]